MIVEKVLEKLPFRSPLLKVVVGSVVTALAISLGMVGILALCGFSIGPAVPSGFAAAGAAIYAAKHWH